MEACCCSRDAETFEMVYQMVVGFLSYVEGLVLVHQAFPSRQLSSQNVDTFTTDGSRQHYLNMGFFYSFIFVIHVS